MDAETLAKELHEAGREAVEKRCVVNPLGIPFLEWDAITEQAAKRTRH